MAKLEFKLIEKLFHEALALPAPERAAFLDETCGRDRELRTAVEELLRHADEDHQTLAGPAASLAAQIRSQQPTLKSGPGATNAAADFPDIPGYDVLEELGRGGMGVVYKARQRSLNRVVALKMLLPAHPADSEMLARFRTEIEALARLEHPHIITIHDIGTDAGRPYFTMEYIDGPSLARLLDGRPQHPMDAARFLETLAHTMHAVHQHGIIHRDLKPANVLLKFDGDALMDEEGHAACQALASFIPKITDFGLAKDQSAASKLTATGVTMGTPSYMAPEQARAVTGAARPASDIYALGSILYEMLTGRPPFEGPAPVDVLHQLLEDEPVSPLAMRPTLPKDLVTICLKCLEKAPNKRYASALELAEDLRRFQAGETIRARPVSVFGRATRWCRRRPLVAGLAAGCLLLLAVLFVTVLVYDFQLRHALARAEGKTEEQRQQIVQLNVRIGITEIDRGDQFMAVLRFTEALRLDEGDPEREREHRSRIAETLRYCPRLLHLRVNDRQVLCTHLGAKGGWVATAGSDHSVAVDDVMTGRAVGPSLQLVETPKCAAVSPDGGLLATVANGGTTRIWNLAMGTSQELPCRGGQSIRQVAFHPDGKFLVTIHADSAVRRWDLTAKHLDVPAPLSPGNCVQAVFSDDARWLFTLDARHIGQAWDLAAGKPLSKAFDVKQDAALAAIGSDGRRVAIVGMDKTLMIWDVAGSQWFGKPKPIRTGVGHLAFSPNSEQLLLVDGAKNLTIWRLRPDEHPSMSCEPARAIDHGHWSEEGRRLLTINETGEARVINLQTGHAETPPLAHGGPLHSISVQGHTIITVAKRGTVAIWELPAGSAPAKDVTPATPDPRPLPELLLAAQVLAGGHIDDRQQWQAFAPGELRLAWENWRSMR